MRGRGPLLIIAATVIAGLAGYAVTFLVFRASGAANYAVFAVFWAAIYLVIGALAGIQQEITRATSPRPVDSVNPANRARNFAVVCTLVVLVVILASSFFWAPAVFPSTAQALVLPLAIGASSYVVVATVSGSLYGVAEWRSIALLIVVDAIVRLVLLIVTLQLTTDVVTLAWAVSLPFPLAVLLLWRFIRRGLVGVSVLDVGYRKLIWNVARTVLASVSTAVMVSGFPLIIGVTARSEPAALVGQLIFTITLTRAPLIVTVMALQSYFVVRFRESSSTTSRTLGVVIGGIVAATAVIAALGWWLGPPVLTLVSGTTDRLGGSVIAVLVISSGLVATLSITSAVVLARSRHLLYSLGWLAAALVTISVMASGVAFIPRVELALIIGPVVGLLVHLVGFAVMRSTAKDRS
ncbi:hypothetical protein BH09ACT1_BH09ACT1_02330 [soil metagenome]